ncbi:efflux transporter outer membrane subunit [Azonexus sp. R2A61]|uniref:efflux transporter outer membrane subunit n=1 Tax=Azonexus sp. R2A61 TaxID=2744443 RepID=UPI001F3F43EC|nr:efflux transporter outer membrane subunit [Azonexus sp. R2A61]
MKIPVFLPFVGLTLSTLILLSGCTLGPDYIRPTASIPPQFKEADNHWKISDPTQASHTTRWWQVFADSLLDQLQEEASRANQEIAAAEANYRQAQAMVGSSRAGLFPNLGLTASESRGKGTTTGNTPAPTRTTDRMGLSVLWEIDLWGRLRRLLEVSQNNASASAEDLAAVRLAVHGSLTQAYLQLRINDAQQRLLERTLTAYRRSHEITRNRYQAGVASQADVAQAETQLKSTEAQHIDLGIQRAQLEHAIAVLTGKPPSSLRIEPEARIPVLPKIPSVLPSTLLERRPDIAAAERRVAAANAQIGVAQAAFFPNLSISATGGYQNSGFTEIFSAPYRYWSLGPALAATVFDAGARSAQKEQSIAAYDRSVATYRQTILNAFRDVEDQLASLRILAAEKEVQDSASRAAGEFQTLTNNQYLGGTVSYLNVATAQAAALNAERNQLDLLNRQLSATVGLIRSLGGWVTP